MEFLSTYGLFLLKTLTIVAAIVFVMVMAASVKSKKEDKGSITITYLNEDLDDLTDEIKNVVLDEETLKLEHKAEKKKHKSEQKDKKKLAKEGATTEERKRLYVMDFDGDIEASEVEGLRKIITAVLSIARANKDEVLLRLESPGGLVHAYGFAASQLDRIRKAEIDLTICVDKVAASGGYMMACVATKIIAAPFAFIGSVGVILQLANFHRLLKDNKVDYETITAGEYKSTLSQFGEITDKGRAKVQQEAQETHNLFKEFIKSHRADLNVDEIATGEAWFATKAIEKGLIDELGTSDEFIVEACKESDVYLISYEKKQKMKDKLSAILEGAFDKTLVKWLHRSSSKDQFMS